MRISSSNVGMESSRQFTSTAKYAASVTVTNTQLLASTADIGNSGAYKDKTFGEVLSGSATEKMDSNVKDSLLGMSQGYFGIRQINASTQRSTAELIDEIRVRTLTFLINLLGGARKNGTNQDRDSLIDKLFQNQTENQTQGSGSSNSATSLLSELTGTSTENTLEWYLGGSSISMNTLTFQEHYTYAESESTSFKTQGTVVTEDGKEISFGVEMAMSRAFAEEYDLNFIRQNATFCDPLVINLDGNIAEVSDEKFLFDIDQDGVMDNISQLSGKSGYLALDLNEDGKINDGSELFGTTSGNGFKDLSKYDSDGNGWIDENDEVWSKLLIWSKDSKGNDTLYHLSEKGIGAISLQNVATDYSLNSTDNTTTNAKIRNTGIFLYENGQVGTVQHLDLAK